MKKKWGREIIVEVAQSFDLFFVNMAFKRKEPHLVAYNSSL